MITDKGYDFFIGSKKRGGDLLTETKFRFLVQHNLLGFIVCFFIGLPVGIYHQEIELQLFMLALSLIYTTIIVVTKYSKNKRVIFSYWLISSNIAFGALFLIAKDSPILLIGWVFVVLLLVSYIYRARATFYIVLYYLILIFIKIKFPTEVELFHLDLSVFHVVEYDIPFNLMLSAVAFSIIINGMNKVNFTMITRIEKNIDEKEILLKEIHHRVKNNMQLIIALLGLQSSEEEDVRLKEALKISENRILSMAMVHEMLYDTEDIHTISVIDYSRKLINNLVSTYQMTDRVKIVAESEDFNLNIDNAVPIGLIVNEIVTNSLKYAFPDKRKGNIIFELSKNKENYCLKIADDGIGIVEGAPVRKNSLGMKLITRLTKQLRGEIKKGKSQNGVSYEITFKGVNHA